MSSFKKFSADTSAVPGTKCSILNGQTLVSSGVPSLDHVLNGGLPLGSLMLIEEDEHGDYARILSRYFMSESVCNRHPLFVASADTDPRTLIAQMPAPVVASSAVTASPAADKLHDEKMKIAWRYQNMNRKEDAVSAAVSAFGQNYDLSRSIPPEVLDSCRIDCWSVDDVTAEMSLSSLDDDVDREKCGQREPFLKMLLACQRFMADSKKDSSASVPSRVVVLSMGSPIWQMKDGGDLVRCCHLLRVLARCSSGVVMVTVPTDYLRARGWERHIGRLRCAADICIGLRSVRSSAATQDYHGMLLCHRLSSLHALSARAPCTADLVFKARRTRFTIETLQLPPELSETVSRSQEEDEDGLRGSQVKSSNRPRSTRPTPKNIDF